MKESTKAILRELPGVLFLMFVIFPFANLKLFANKKLWWVMVIMYSLLSMLLVTGGFHVWSFFLVYLGMFMMSYATVDKIK